MQVTVDFMMNEGVSSPLSEADVERVCDKVLLGEGVARPCYVSVSLVDDAEMRSLNAEWRGIDAETDVLSLECERPDDPDLAPDEPCELGDIILAPAYIKAQAKRLNTPYASEFTLLLVHGMLHLLGYDHLEDEDARIMEAREDELVSLLIGGDSHVTLTRHKEGDQL